MYSCITNVNILTSLLIAHGIREAVVCPGSHNAPLVHNLNACGSIRCQPVTDERSAGFVALGMAIKTERPVAVCVTSGSALLNLLPAVAEAFYQQMPLIIISADRAQAWIDQLDGQTLPQPDAMGRFVRCAVNLPEPSDDTQRWHCNRLVNEALLSAIRHRKGPVHINVPISKDLHKFDKMELPRERKIFSSGGKNNGIESGHPLAAAFCNASRRMIILGQLPQSKAKRLTPALHRMASQNVVIHECLGGEAFLPCPVDAVLRQGNDKLAPDFILYLGRTLVSKPLKEWLRRQKAECWMVNAEGKVEDTTGRMAGVAEAEEEKVLCMLEHIETNCDTAFMQEWENCMARARMHCISAELPWSQAAAVRTFEQRIYKTGNEAQVCYANSSAVRLGNLFAQAYRQCNRGVNGIEGSLSTAVGMSLVSEDKHTFCVVGDLSFFYDQNALWIQGLSSNLRILLLNNGGGGIFTRFEGLRESKARKSLIMGCHSTSAQGICQSYGVQYRSAATNAELDEGLDFLMNAHTDAPCLLEVFTDMETDHEAMSLLDRLPCSPEL